MTKFITPKFFDLDNIKMIQTTRHLGFSKGRFDSFNLSSSVGDNNDHVDKNENLLLKKVPNLQWIFQEHGNKVVELPSNNLIGDAVFTKKKNIVCAVRTADCLPILLTNKNMSFVAAIHAGWRSLALGIIENTIISISSNSEVYAWLGPSISIENYEVGKEFYNYFMNIDDDLSNAFLKIDDKYKFSLPIAARIKLNKIGVNKIYGSTVDQDFCTFNDDKRFYSYRRDKTTGRMASMIWINDI